MCQSELQTHPFQEGDSFTSLRDVFLSRKLSSNMQAEGDEAAFRWRLNVLSLGGSERGQADAYFYRLNCNGGWWYTPSPERSLINLVIPVVGGVSLQREAGRIDAEPGEALVYQNHVLTRKRMRPFEGCFECIGLTMEFRRAERVLAELLQAPIEADLRLTPKIDLKTTHGHIAASMMERLSLLPGTDSGSGLTPQLQQRLVDAFAHLLLECSPHRYTDRLIRQGSGAVPGYIRRARDYMWRHCASDLSMTDVAAEVQVSLRTLESGFRKFLDTTPGAYLRTLRLRLARKRLQSNADACSIGEIAKACGFQHVGRFARYYMQAYGETPSQTRQSGAQRT